jgi:PAS domain S-box-containing protein
MQAVAEELLHFTTATTTDTLLLVDAELVVRFINRGSSGMGIADIVGRDVSVLLPEDMRESLIARLRRTLTTGEAETFEFELASENAENQYFESRASVVRDGGTASGIIIAVHSITERRRLEQEVVDVSGRERQAIGRDLHDGLGQELTGVALMLRALATRFAGLYPEATHQVDEIVSRVNRSIETAHSLAHSTLPVDTRGGGLAGALQSLADRSRELYGFDVDCQIEVSPDRALDGITTDHLYRIAQEALANAMRHAHASLVQLYLLVDSRQFLLRIIDNGVGLSRSPVSNCGMGLNIMRYRASTIGARFEILPNDPHGAVVSVTGRRKRPAPGTAGIDRRRSFDPVPGPAPPSGERGRPRGERRGGNGARHAKRDQG